jgi:microcystin-dependent protein
VLGLTSLTNNHIFVGNASNQPTDVAMSGDASIAASGALTIASGAINNAKVAAGAAIAVTKLAAQTASRATAFDSSGFITPSATNATELGYVSGVTSPIQAQINALQQVPSGSMLDFAGTVAPTGWLLCDGSAVSRTTYARLFSAISTNWGVGDGSTTFNLPNMTRRVGMGAGGSGSGTIGNTVGNVGGEETHVLTTPEIPAHSHTATDSGHVHGEQVSVGAGATTSIVGTVNLNTGAVNGAGITTNTGTANITVSNTGGGGAHNNIQPSAIVLKIIKT